MPAAALNDRLNAFAPREVARGARTFGYRSAGEGPALVLLHGIGSGSGSWIGQLDAFADRHRVIAWDAPGYGATTALDAASPVADDYAAALLALLDELVVPRCDIVAHSLGGLMGAAFARRHPGRVRSLTLASPAIGYGDAPAELRDSRLRERLDAIRALGPEGLARERAARLLSPTADEEAIALVRWNMSRLDPHGYAQASRLLAGGRLLDDVSTRAVPMFVLCGSQDRITPPDGAMRVARAAGAGYRELAGAGHACYVEACNAFNDAVRSFIENVHEQD